MNFEFNTSEDVGLMEIISRKSGNRIIKGVLQLPESIGKGYLKRISFGSKMNMMIHQYELTTGVSGKRKAIKSQSDTITFSFRNVVALSGDKMKSSRQLLPAVQVSSADMDLDLSFPARTQINSIVIGIHVDLLKDLINKEEENVLLQTITSRSSPFLYEEIISPAIQNTAAEILSQHVSEELQDFHYKLKAQELIFLFFCELLKRKDVANYAINSVDVKMLYLIRDKVIADLKKPPILSELTKLSGMSESKMNRLFKQIFGNTIYNYHQKLRITEAAHLVKNKDMSVSEAGYLMGFTNLSHFTRIFKKHIGLKPKKYSLQ